MFEKDELYTSIYSALATKIDEDTAGKKVLHELTLTIRESVVGYTEDLVEALGHLQETVKRLSKVDS